MPEREGGGGVVKACADSPVCGADWSLDVSEFQGEHREVEVVFYCIVTAHHCPQVDVFIVSFFRGRITNRDEISGAKCLS